ncbi:MAG: prepilin-type N-terminal cleavage/methylation domain-containing protein [Prochlorococcaceae cyanobacterium]
MSRRPVAAGFSLVEVMVTVVVLGVLGSMDGSAMVALLRDQRLRAGSETLVAWLEEQRRRAIQTARSCTIEVVGASGLLRPLAGTNACGSIPPFVLAEVSGSSVRLCASASGPTQTAPACTGTSGTGSLSIVLTPRGTSTTDALLQLAITGHSPNRCVQLIAPLGLLRPGQVINGRCDWSSAF